jgi:hypothetical protein
MKHTIRLTGLALLLLVGVACSSGSTDSQLDAVPASEEQPGAPASEPQAATPAAAPMARIAPRTEQAPEDRPRASAGAPAAAYTPAEPPKPAFMEMTVPAGTALNLQLVSPVSSDGSQVEDIVRAKVTKPVVISGMTVIPEGAEVVGSVVEANQAGRVKGRASVAFRFNRVTVAGQTFDIRTARVAREAEPTKGEDAKKVGIGAGAGAIIGAIAGGKKGAAVGTAVGGGAGAGAVLATRGDEVRLGAGAPVRTTIEDAVKIMAPM